MCMRIVTKKIMFPLMIIKRNVIYAISKSRPKFPVVSEALTVLLNILIFMSVGTAHKHGINSFKTVLFAVCGKPCAFRLETE